MPPRHQRSAVSLEGLCFSGPIKLITSTRAQGSLKCTAKIEWIDELFRPHQARLRTASPPLFSLDRQTFMLPRRPLTALIRDYRSASPSAPFSRLQDGGQWALKNNHRPCIDGSERLYRLLSFFSFSFLAVGKNPPIIAFSFRIKTDRSLYVLDLFTTV